MTWDSGTYRFIEETTRCTACSHDPTFRGDRTIYGEEIRHPLYTCEACDDPQGNAIRGYRILSLAEAETREAARRLLAEAEELEK